MRKEYNEDMQNPGLKEEKEAKEHRERTMRRIIGVLKEDQKKKRERAKEILGKYPDAPNSRHELMQNALKAAQDDVKISKKQQKRGQRAHWAISNSDDEFCRIDLRHPCNQTMQYPSRTCTSAKHSSSSCSPNESAIRYTLQL